MIETRIPMLGFAAYSGTGKTTLLLRLLALLRGRGLRIGMLKHAHHNFEVDQPGKDSYELRKAGAEQMLVASGRRWVLLVEQPDPLTDPDLGELVAKLDQARLDLILVEGFKHESFPKIELFRPSLGYDLMCTEDPNIIAVASDGPLPATVTIPRLDLNRPEEIEAFILAWAGLR